MSSKPYDVVLLPERDLAQKALDLSGSLQRLGTCFTLDEKTYYPHLSLYMLQLTEAGLAKALSLLSEVADETPSINAVANQYHYSHEYLDVEYVATESFAGLQREVIQRLNPIRDGLREKDKERLATAIGEERENILKYGYRSAGTRFAPHLTFTRFMSEQPEVLSLLPSPETFNGTFLSLGIFEMGEHGTCIAPVHVWDLK